MTLHESAPIEHESAPSIRRRVLRNQLAVATAIAHGVGAHMSLSDLLDVVLEHGLPPREERERIRQERLAGDAADAGDDTTEGSSSG